MYKQICNFGLHFKKKEKRKRATLDVKTNTGHPQLSNLKTLQVSLNPLKKTAERHEKKLNP